jgi:hypothetical protein
MFCLIKLHVDIISLTYTCLCKICTRLINWIFNTDLIGSSLFIMDFTLIQIDVRICLWFFLTSSFCWHHIKEIQIQIDVYILIPFYRKINTCIINLVCVHAFYYLLFPSPPVDGVSYFSHAENGHSQWMYVQIVLAFLIFYKIMETSSQ